MPEALQVSDTTDFSYGDAEASQTSRTGMSIYANRAHVRQEMREDADAAGFAIRECESLAPLLHDEPHPQGEVVLIDCPEVTERGAEALARLDVHAARTGTQLMLSTTFPSLDSVYAACGTSDPVILVNATRAGRVIALGQVLAAGVGSNVRELSEQDRLTLLRLSEQVNQLAGRLEGLGPTEGGGSFAGLAEEMTPENAQTNRSSRAALPDPRLVRQIIQHRQARAKYFEGDLFADPAWDMLLDLTAARIEHQRVSVTSLCIASGVPPTTALRWITQMTKAGMLERVEDDADKRRAFIALSDGAADAMARYFAAMGPVAAHLN